MEEIIDMLRKDSIRLKEKIQGKKVSDFTQAVLDMHDGTDLDRVCDTIDMSLVGVDADFIPRKIKELYTKLINSKISDKEKNEIRKKISGLEEKLKIVRLKQEISRERYKRQHFVLALERENERKEEAKAQLEELRIKYGDELIKSLIA